MEVEPIPLGFYADQHAKRRLFLKKRTLLMEVVEEMVDTRRIETGGAANDAVNFVPF